MSDVSDQDQELVQYVLGRLPSAEQAKLEDRYMADDDLHERLRAATDEVIQAYLSGDLSPDDKMQFETHFMASPRRRERVEFMRTLNTAVAHRRPAAGTNRGTVELPRYQRWWAIAATLFLAIGAVVALLSRRQTPTVNVAAIASPSPPQARSSESAGGPHAPQSPLPTSSGASHLQRVRIPQGATTPVEIDVPPLVRTVRLEVAVDDSHPSYDVSIQIADGSKVWHSDDLPAPDPGEPLVVAVPADVLSAGDFVLAVDGEALRGRPFSSKYRLRVHHSAGR